MENIRILHAVKSAAAKQIQEVKFFLEKFKNGDANEITFCMALIDTFINKNYLYDSYDARIEIFCNASDMNIKCSLDKLESSPKEQLAF